MSMSDDGWQKFRGVGIEILPAADAPRVDTALLRRALNVLGWRGRERAPALGPVIHLTKIRRHPAG